MRGIWWCRNQSLEQKHSWFFASALHSVVIPIRHNADARHASALFPILIYQTDVFFCILYIYTHLTAHGSQAQSSVFADLHAATPSGPLQAIAAYGLLASASAQMMETSDSIQAAMQVLADDISALESSLIDQRTDKAVSSSAEGQMYFARPWCDDVPNALQQRYTFEPSEFAGDVNISRRVLLRGSSRKADEDAAPVAPDVPYMGYTISTAGEPSGWFCATKDHWSYKNHHVHVPYFRPHSIKGVLVASHSSFLGSFQWEISNARWCWALISELTSCGVVCENPIWSRPQYWKHFQSYDASIRYLQVYALFLEWIRICEEYIRSVVWSLCCMKLNGFFTI